MTAPRALRICLIITGAYYAHVGLKPYFIALITAQSDFWAYLSIVNAIPDIMVTAFGLGLIWCVVTQSKKLEVFVIAVAILSWLGLVVGLGEFYSLLGRGHTSADIMRHSFDLVCCAVGLVSTSIVWWMPGRLQMLIGSGQAHSNQESKHG